MDTQTPQSHKPRTKQTISLPAAIISAAALIAIALIVVFSPKTTTQQPATSGGNEVTSVPATVATIRPTDRVRGDSTTAKVAIIEYSDSDCPFCSRFHTTMQQIIDTYGNDIAWVYRYFPLSSLHPNAVTEAVALECVASLGGNDAFNTYLDQLINVTLNPDPKSNEMLATFATAQNIDGKLFKTCMAGTVASSRVKADTDEAAKIGAKGTPFSILVNLKTGKQIIVPGAYPYENIKKDIDSLLK